MASARTPRSFGAATSFAIALALATTVAPSLAEPPKGNASPSGSSSAQSVADAAKEKKERQARAVELHDEAKTLYERGLYRRAITKLEAALALDPEGKELVYNLALIHEKLAEADIAEGYYLRYIDMETDPKAREHAQGIVKRLQGAKQKLKDDLKERAAPSAAPSSSAAASSAVGAQVHRARMPSPMVFVIGGVAIAAAGVGVGFGVSALANNPSDASTGPRTTAYDLETRARSAHTQAVVADLAFGASVVVGAAATLLYLLESRAPSKAPASTAIARARVRMEAPF